jgi:lipopolysaccharide transport system ATP-binding protein
MKKDIPELLCPKQQDTFDPIISLRDVGYFYYRKTGFLKKEKLWVLHKVSFDVYRGETLGFIGKNGVGKTTMLKIIAGIIDPDKGQVINNGIKISLLSIQAGFTPHLSGRENTYLSGMLLGMNKKDIQKKLHVIKEFSGLGEYFDQPVKAYSTGMRARLGFSLGLQLDTELLLVDEVIGVGDGEFRKKSTEKMKEQIKSNKTVILVSHIPDLIKELCDRVVFIKSAKKVVIGKPEDILPIYQNYLQKKV